jgi:hypothetical protein
MMLLELQWLATLPYQNSKFTVYNQQETAIDRHFYWRVIAALFDIWLARLIHRTLRCGKIGEK